MTRDEIVALLNAYLDAETRYWEAWERNQDTEDEIAEMRIAAEMARGKFDHALNQFWRQL